MHAVALLDGSFPASSMVWQVRLREYFHRTKHLHVAERRRKLLCTLSPTLQGQIVLHINSRWLNRVWFFQVMIPPPCRPSG